MEIIKEGNKHCLKKIAELSDEDTEKLIGELCSRPCRLHATNRASQTMSVVSQNLKKDGFQHILSTGNNVITQENVEDYNEPLTRCIGKIRKMMLSLGHRIYRGLVFKKREEGKLIKHLELPNFSINLGI